MATRAGSLLVTAAHEMTVLVAPLVWIRGLTVRICSARDTTRMSPRSVVEPAGQLLTFGRITTMSGNPRLMQFGVKYGF